MNNELPRLGDEDTCPICLMPVLPDEGGCVRHDFAEMIAWGNKYRRDRDAMRAQLGEAVALLRKLRVNHPTGSWGLNRRILRQMSTGAETCALWDGVDAFLDRVKGV